MSEERACTPFDQGRTLCPAKDLCSVTASGILPQTCLGPGMECVWSEETGMHREPAEAFPWSLGPGGPLLSLCCLIGLRPLCRGVRGSVSKCELFPRHCSHLDMVLTCWAGHGGSPWGTSSMVSRSHDGFISSPARPAWSCSGDTRRWHVLPSEEQVPPDARDREERVLGMHSLGMNLGTDNFCSVLSTIL